MRFKLAKRIKCLSWRPYKSMYKIAWNCNVDSAVKCKSKRLRALKWQSEDEMAGRGGAWLSDFSDSAQPLLHSLPLDKLVFSLSFSPLLSVFFPFAPKFSWVPPRWVKARFATGRRAFFVLLFFELRYHLFCFRPIFVEKKKDIFFEFTFTLIKVL